MKWINKIVDRFNNTIILAAFIFIVILMRMLDLLTIEKEERDMKKIDEYLETRKREDYGYETY